MARSTSTMFYTSSGQRGRRGLVFQQQWVRSSEFAVDRAEIGALEHHEERSGGRVHGGFLACLHCDTNNNELRFVDGMLCNWCARTPRGMLWWASSWSLSLLVFIASRNSSEFRFLYSPMACFAIFPQVITHFSQDRVQQRLHPQRELYTMSATRLCTLVSPSLPCASCRRVDRLEATSFLPAIGVGLLIAVLSGVFTA